MPRYPRKAQKGLSMSPYPERLWDAFVECGSAGAMWEEFVILPAKLTVARLADFAATTLVSAATVWIRWCEWTDSKHRSHEPSSVFRDAAWTSLRLLEIHLGLPFCTRSPAVVAWGRLPPGSPG